MAAWRYEISLLVLKKYFKSERSERVKYFSTREQKSSVCYSYPVDSVIHLLSNWGLGPPV